MKRKTLTLVLCLLTVMSLVGVGFASWVISADTSEKVEGNIVVDTVSDARYTLTISKPEVVDIYLTGPQGATNGWLTYTASNDKKTVNLTVEYTFTVTKNDGTKFVKQEMSVDGYNYVNLKDLYITAVFNGPDKKDNSSKDTAFGTLFTNGVIKEIGESGYEIGLVTLSDNDATASFKVKVGYAWSTAFDNENPFVYFNKKGANELSNTDYYSNIEKETYADVAKYFLTLLQGIDNSGAKFNATITVSKDVPTGATGALVSKTQVNPA